VNGQLNDLLPVGWIAATLGDIGIYLNGRGFKASEWSNNGRMIIRIQDLTGTGSSPNHYEGEVDPTIEVAPGDLLISWAATLGAYIWRGPPAVLNQHIFKVQTFVDRLFHYYTVRVVLDDLYRQSHGSGMVHITKSRFEGTRISLPPLPEQHRIVAAIESYLSRLDAASAALERVKRNLARYRAAVLHAAVTGRLVATEAEVARAEGREYEPASTLLARILAERRRRWEEVELAKMTAAGRPPKGDRWKARYVEPVAPETEELGELPEGWCWISLEQASWDSSYGTSAKCDINADGIPVLRIPNVSRGRLDLTDLKFATVPLHLNRGDELAQDDFLVIRTNGSKDLIGRAALVTRHLDEPYYFASYLIRFRLAPEIAEGQWLSVWWHSPSVRSQVISEAATSAGQYNISMTALARQAIALPPKAEQHRIHDQVECLLSVGDEAERAMGQDLGRMTRLRQSILRLAFEGRLVDQNPDDESATVLLERIRAERSASIPTRRGRPRRTEIATQEALL